MQLWPKRLCLTWSVAVEKNAAVARNAAAVKTGDAVQSLAMARNAVAIKTGAVRLRGEVVWREGRVPNVYFSPSPHPGRVGRRGERQNSQF